MLYEHKIHPNWNTHQFDYSRGEVRSFLVSNALYWAELFHADGIRMDGVSSMLYMNFGIDDPGQKRFNEKGTEEDLNASAFIRQTNAAMGKFYPDVMMIAEESTAWPLVTYPPENGGLGFHFKWDMGWMNDTLHYMQTDFPWRPGNHRMLTFSTMYQFNENFILPLSHDEVVNGKCSLITRMPGDYWRQFAGMRALAFYQMTHAGGKLNFMGNEIAQFIEWRYYEAIQYFLAEQYETHRHQQTFVRELNRFYNGHPALWQRAFESEGFEWIDADNNDQSIVTFIRKGDKPGDELVILINFDVNAREDFRMGVARVGRLRGAVQLRRGALRRLRRRQHRQDQVPGRAVERPRAVRRRARPAAGRHGPQAHRRAAPPGQEDGGQDHQGATTKTTATKTAAKPAAKKAATKTTATKTEAKSLLPKSRLLRQKSATRKKASEE